MKPKADIKKKSMKDIADNDGKTDDESDVTPDGDIGGVAHSIMVGVMVIIFIIAITVWRPMFQEFWGFIVNSINSI